MFQYCDREQQAALRPPLLGADTPLPEDLLRARHPALAS